LAIVESTPSTSSKSTLISTKAVVELGLREWYMGLFEPQPMSGKIVKGVDGDVGGNGVVPMDAPAVVRQNSVKEEVKKALLTDLVGVYVRSSNMYVLVLSSPVIV